MAEPFSTLAATAGLIEICWKVGKYLNNLKGAAESIQADIDALQQDITSLIDVNESIEKFRGVIEDADSSSPLISNPVVDDLWQKIVWNSAGCKNALLQLEEVVKAIMGKSQTSQPTSKIDGLRKTLKRQSTNPALERIHDRLSKYHQSLLMLLTALNLYYTRSSHKATDRLEKQESKLEYQVQALRSKINSDDDDFLETIATAMKIQSKPLNKHFILPRSVSSIFTGREVFLKELEEALDDDESLEDCNTQRRFVVQGLGGSGKTEFCCKFAQINRQKFWGVFSINATSRETAKEGFAAISKIGGVEPNDRAAKSWLSSLEEPWMLIIDNADDPSLNVEDFFPEGERGFILITTRVPENIKHGTIKPRSFQFEKLESDASTSLLLRAAGMNSPWDEKTIESAGLITSTLGYLPLALIHAGSAIANKLCEIGNYLSYFKMFWETIREARKVKGRGETEDDKTYMGVYSSYEIICQDLEKRTMQKFKDAVELLRVFAFFNRENIKLETLIAAAKNPLSEAIAEEKAQQEKGDKKDIEKSKSWSQIFKELLFALRTEVLKDRSQPVLLNMLRDVVSIPKFEHRLRQALHVLTQYSLVMYHEDNRSYSMHPLVHFWARERPHMTLGEQAVWSEAATNTLGQCISLPLHGTHTTEEMEIQRSLLLHVIHLHACKAELREKIQENQRTRKGLWPVVPPKSDLIVVDRRQAMQAAKFSYIYFICGSWDEAQQLQEAVRDFLVPNLGLKHTASIRISRFLATTYLLKGRFNDAGDLSEKVLQAAKEALGDDNRTTLQLMDNLGTIRNLQGRFAEAEALYSDAIERMTRTLGPNHQETLCTIDNLGQVFWSYFMWEKAKEYHSKAVAGMEVHPSMGPTHEKTIGAKENLALAYRELGGEYLEKAHKMMEEILQWRTEVLGREQPYTLIAMSNLAYIKLAMGDYEDAEKILLKGMPIGERNLGEYHHGVVAAKLRLAQIWTAQERYKEAEALFRRILDREKYASRARKEGPVKGDHKDRIFTLYQFVFFWERQKKFKEALENCEELCEILQKSKHPIAQLARDKRDDLRAITQQDSDFFDPTF